MLRFELHGPHLIIFPNRKTRYHIDKNDVSLKAGFDKLNQRINDSRPVVEPVETTLKESRIQKVMEDASVHVDSPDELLKIVVSAVE